MNELSFSSIIPNLSPSPSVPNPKSYPFQELLVFSKLKTGRDSPKKRIASSVYKFNLTPQYIETVFKVIVEAPNIGSKRIFNLFFLIESRSILEITLSM